MEWSGMENCKVPNCWLNQTLFTWVGGRQTWASSLQFPPANAIPIHSTVSIHASPQQCLARATTPGGQRRMRVFYLFVAPAPGTERGVCWSLQVRCTLGPARPGGQSRARLGAAAQACLTELPSPSVFFQKPTCERS